MTVAFSLLVILLRAAMLVHFFAVPYFASWVFAASEASVLVLSVRGLCVGQVDRSVAGLFVPLAYLTPLLFIPVNYQPSFGVFVVFLGGVQVILRGLMFGRVSAGVPVYVKLLRHFPYTIVRHPLAMVEALLSVAYVMAFPGAWNVCVLPVVLGAMVGCTELEERFLRRVSDYRAYAENVPWRFVPGVW